MRPLVQSHWLDRRVGAGGPRSATCRALVEMLPIVINGDPIGLDERALDGFCEAHRLERLAAHFPTRGEPSALRRIARFGAQLIAVACAAAGLGAEFPLLVEGALFNLGVALFDTVVDDEPYRLPALTDCLNPSRIRAHLLLGVALPTCADAGVELIVSLFRALFESIRNRTSPTRLPALAASLTRMYNAEVSDPAAAISAKRLPVTFIGELVADDRSASAIVMERLGLFIALLDDWHDLAVDLVNRQPNSFLGGDASAARVRYSGLRLWRLIGGPISRVEIGFRLGFALHEAVAASRSAGPQCGAAMATFLGGLLGADRQC